VQLRPDRVRELDGTLHCSAGIIRLAPMERNAADGGSRAIR
jgi:hypothetical protein